jgi:hypothetical protein
MTKKKSAKGTHPRQHHAKRGGGKELRPGAGKKTLANIGKLGDSGKKTRAKLTVEKDRYGLFWEVIIECQGVVLKTSMAEKPKLSDPKIQKMITGMIHSQQL